MDKVLEKAWIDYVEFTLSETKERDDASLGGVKPDMSVRPRQAVLNAVNASQVFNASPPLASARLNGSLGGQQGLDSIDLSINGSDTSATFGSSSASLLSSFGSSSDDEDEEMDEAEKEGSLRVMIALSTLDTGESENVGCQLRRPSARSEAHHQS